MVSFIHIELFLQLFNICYFQTCMLSGVNSPNFLVNLGNSMNINVYFFESEVQDVNYIYCAEGVFFISFLNLGLHGDLLMGGGTRRKAGSCAGRGEP